MKRREFIATLGGATAWPLVAGAQQPPVLLIGYLSSRSFEESRHLVDAFQAGLQSNGYTEGQNIAVEYR